MFACDENYFIKKKMSYDANICSARLCSDFDAR